MISRIAGKPCRSAMSTLLTTGIQLNSLHYRLTPHLVWHVKTDHRAIASHGPPEVYRKRTRPASAAATTRAKASTIDP
ncbi:hypothetical protein [Xanthomonas arboricola]|uniref:hypothetical protein n=1 Tax=Xanthomonas arboricola TaxID=56448 RepID=UPI003EBE9932